MHELCASPDPKAVNVALPLAIPRFGHISSLLGRIGESLFVSSSAESDSKERENDERSQESEHCVLHFYIERQYATAP